MRIDLRSDTVTKPTKEMRKAAYDAEVGDDVYREDVTVRKLEEKTAEILGKEDALFVTSGTQGNQIAVLTHTNLGNEIILEAESHIFYYETGSTAAFAGVQSRTIPGIRGAMDPAQVEQAIRPEDQHFPETGLICIENTHNRAGGAVVPVSNLQDIFAIAKKHSIPVHIDGARLFNAAIAIDKPVTEFTQYSDTVQICLSKGLGAPVGSVIAGSKEFIKSARKWRKRLGGGLRQAGIIAAPGLVALQTMRERLIEDHEAARILAEGMNQIKGIKVSNVVETNIVIVDVKGLNVSSTAFVHALKQEGILANSFGPTQIRFTTHYDVSIDQIHTALSTINKLASSSMVTL